MGETAFVRTVHLVTHPEATHAVCGLVGGWYDSDLTPRGAAQAERIATEVADRVPAHGVEVVASDLRRTRLTADAIAERLGVEPALDAGLRERSYGEADGRRVGTVDVAPLPPTGDRLRHHDGVHGSENRLAVATRVYAAVERIIKRGTDHAVIVTHGGAATFVITAWIGMPLDSIGLVKFAVSSGSITVLEQDATGGRHVTSLNEVAHLG